MRGGGGIISALEDMNSALGYLDLCGDMVSVLGVFRNNNDVPPMH